MKNMSIYLYILRRNVTKKFKRRKIHYCEFYKISTIFIALKVHKHLRIIISLSFSLLNLQDWSIWFILYICQRFSKKKKMLYSKMIRFHTIVRNDPTCSRVHFAVSTTGHWAERRWTENGILDEISIRPALPIVRKRPAPVRRESGVRDPF